MRPTSRSVAQQKRFGVCVCVCVCVCVGVLDTASLCRLDLRARRPWRRTGRLLCFFRPKLTCRSLYQTCRLSLTNSPLPLPLSTNTTGIEAGACVGVAPVAASCDDPAALCEQRQSRVCAQPCAWLGGQHPGVLRLLLCVCACVGVWCVSVSGLFVYAFVSSTPISRLRLTLRLARLSTPRRVASLAIFFVMSLSRVHMSGVFLVRVASAFTTPRCVASLTLCVVVCLCLVFVFCVFVSVWATLVLCHSISSTPGLWCVSSFIQSRVSVLFFLVSLFLSVWATLSYVCVLSRQHPCVMRLMLSLSCVNFVCLCLILSEHRQILCLRSILVKHPGVMRLLPHFVMSQSHVPLSAFCLFFMSVWATLFLRQRSISSTPRCDACVAKFCHVSISCVCILYFGVFVCVCLSNPYLLSAFNPRCDASLALFFMSQSRASVSLFFACV